MKNQLHVLSFILVSFLTSSGCGSKPTNSTKDDEIALTSILHDLQITEGKTRLLFRNSSSTQPSHLGPREEAIVLTSSGSNYTLRYAIRYPQTETRWSLWVNHEIGEDGTGLESPAIREYSQEPTPEIVSAFRSEIRDHWSNR